MGRFELLSSDTVATYIVERGLCEPAEVAVVEPLGGGVSNIVLAVRVGNRHLVVKQSLPRLRVADEWRAKRERVLTDAAAIERCGEVTPGSVPRVFDVDPRACAIAMEHAPAGWVTWKERLLAGEVAVEVAARLGEILAAWHAIPVSTLERFDDHVAFEQLRIDPYYRTVAERHPDLVEVIDGHIAGLRDRRSLVHGDDSPKNVLVGDAGELWVIDHEVAHLGAPAFDLAFLTSHLLLKAVH